MDISNWSIDRIMQLPDWCFGRKWNLITSYNVAKDTTEQWLVKQSLPERIVLWEFGQVNAIGEYHGAYIIPALGDHDPANKAEFDAFERIFKGDLENGTFE